MHTPLTKPLFLAALLGIASASSAWAQSVTEAPLASPTQASFDKALKQENTWYFSWGYSRQQYAPSDIHVSQPGLGNDFTVQQASAKDFPTSAGDTLNSLFSLDSTNPQENVRVGKFMNPEKTFAIEF